jgi:hypothetical protein
MVSTWGASADVTRVRPSAEMRPVGQAFRPARHHRRRAEDRSQQRQRDRPRRKRAEAERGSAEGRRPARQAETTLVNLEGSLADSVSALAVLDTEIAKTRASFITDALPDARRCESRRGVAVPSLPRHRHQLRC